MPEGPEIRRATDAVRDAVCGRKTIEVSFGLSHLKPFEKKLTGIKVTSVKSRGKALLTRFENGLTIYSHNQLYGRWYIQESYKFPDTNRQLRLAIHNRKQSALLYSASEIEVLNDKELEAHSFLAKLGPDILERTTDNKKILERLTDKKFFRRQLGNFLTDQTFLAGLGNYLRCEILFVVGLHPSIRPCDCNHAQLNLLAETILGLTQQSYKTGGITNDLQQTNKLKRVYAETCGLILAFLGNGGRNAAIIFSLRYSSSR